MKVIEGPEAIQGSDAWLRYRAGFLNASDAPAMLGCSSYKTRDALLREKATGIVPEVDEATQRRFDEGHRIEALARPLAEKIVGESLSPIVANVGRMSASSDGITFGGAINFEHKKLNAALRDAMHDGCTGADLPLEYQVQMQQQCMVFGCERVLFMASKWDGDELVEERHCWFTPNDDLADRITRGWDQFQQDLAAWKPAAPAAPAAIGHAPETLPALAVTITGAVTASNLPEFRERALWLIRNVKTELSTDQDFSDAEQTVKWCAEIEKRIAGVKQAALAQTASIDELFRTMDAISDEARRVRLQLSKSVKSEKDARKTAITAAAIKEVQAHVDAQNRRCTFNAITYDGGRFATAIKGMSSLANMQSALNDVVAAIKIETSAEADRIAANVATLDANKDNAALFPDWKALALKQADDLAAVIAARIAQAKEAEAKRLEAERERIRAEEEAKARNAAAVQQLSAERARLAAHATAAANALPVALLQTHNSPAENEAWERAVEDEVQPAAKPVIAIDGPFTVDTPASIPSNSTELERPTLTLGAINERLAPIHLTAAGLAKFDIEPAATDKNAKLYTEGQFFNLLCELTDHLDRVMSKVRRAQTEAEAV